MVGKHQLNKCNVTLKIDLIAFMGDIVTYIEKYSSLYESKLYFRLGEICLGHSAMVRCFT